jgi:hypothetical protein
LKRFEITGQIALGTLIRIAMAFDEIEGFANLFPERRPVPATMAELEKMHPPARKRGRTVR